VNTRNKRNIREHGNKVWCFFRRLGYWGGWRIRVFGEIGRVGIDFRHVDMRISVIHEIMSGHVNLFGFLMGFSSSDEEVSSDFLLFLLLLLLSFFLL